MNKNQETKRSVKNFESKKVIIIEPSGSDANVFSRYMNLPLMGTIYLGTILNQAGFDVTIYNENFLLKNSNQSKGITIDMLVGDFLLLSLITPSAERGYELAKLFKRANPHGKVIIGGVHPTLLPEEAINYADHVVQGEGEKIIVDLLKYGHNEKIIKTELIEDLNSIPIPNFNLLYKNEIMDIYPIITSRGCPFDCNFCSVTKTFGRKYRTVDTDRIVYELAQTKHRQIFFYDDNFTANKQRTKELLKKMIDQKLNKVWSAQTRIDIADDPELLELMKQSGCIKVYLGLESINNQVLKEYHKSQTVEQIENSMAKIHAAGICIHGMFIFGADHDTANIFSDTVKFCKKNKIETLQYLALTPYPGTKIFDDMEREQRLVHKIWRYYDALHVVFRPKNFSPLELQHKIISSFEEFYSFTHTLGQALKAASGLPQRIETTLTRLFARHIISRWKKLNLNYLKYLGREADTSK